MQVREFGRGERELVLCRLQVRHGEDFIFDCHSISIPLLGVLSAIRE